jgi:RHS repeat-associated protein
LEKAYDFYPYGLPVKETVGQERLWFASYELEHQDTPDYTDDLYFLHARWYFPYMARFLSPDPVRGDPAQPQSFNLYAYVRGNPLNAVDPDGRITLDAYQAAQAASEQEYYDASGERRAFFGTGDWLASRGMLWYTTPQEAPGGGGGQEKAATPVATEEGEGGSVVICYSDGRKEVRKGGSRAWRNNNLGNLVYSDETKEHGAIGAAGGIPGTKLKFAVFPSEEAGDAALRSYLARGSRADLTLSELIARYAPLEHNDTSRYTAFVLKTVGGAGETKVRALTSDQLMKLIRAIKTMEGWVPGSVVKE